VAVDNEFEGVEAVVEDNGDSAILLIFDAVIYPKNVSWRFQPSCSRFRLHVPDLDTPVNHQGQLEAS
jgi:hypothetical protein